MSLRIALFGQAPLAADCLNLLLAEGHEIVCVFAPPDRGRPDPLAEGARNLGLRVIQRRYFQTRDRRPIPAALEEYCMAAPDLNVLASFTAFLPPEICDAPSKRSICFHPSLLPRYRGGNALQWQIIEGERESGVSIFVPDEGVDTGPIVIQKGGVEISPQDTTASLFFQKLVPLGVEALVEAVRRIDAGTVELRPQDESVATFQGLVDDAAAAIDFSWPAHQIDLRVRGCDPQPGARARINGREIRLYDAGLDAAAAGKPGELLSVDAPAIRIALVGGTLRVARVRADAGKEPAWEFVKRTGLRAGDFFENG